MPQGTCQTYMKPCQTCFSISQRSYTFQEHTLLTNFTSKLHIWRVLLIRQWNCKHTSSLNQAIGEGPPSFASNSCFFSKNHAFGIITPVRIAFDSSSVKISWAFLRAFSSLSEARKNIHVKHYFFLYRLPFIHDLLRNKVNIYTSIGRLSSSFVEISLF